MDRLSQAIQQLRRTQLMLLSCTVLSLLVACAQAPSNSGADAHETNDPLEPTNRKILALDEFVDRYSLEPVARTYRDYVPDQVQYRLHDFLANLQAPVIEINDLLQGNISRGWTTLQRFAVNSTIGGLGLFDVASDWHLPFHDADYGETLAAWGIGEGPYVVLPIFGPSNVRDAIGFGLGFVLDPLGFIGGANAAYAGYARGVTGAIDDRTAQLDTLDEMKKNSIDFYAEMRSMYRQHREFEVAEAIGKANRNNTASVTLEEPDLIGP